MSERPGPSHYQVGTVQPIDLIHSAGLDFDEGNVIKYVTRWRHKDGLADLLKARVYLDWIIERAQRDSAALRAGELHVSGEAAALDEQTD